MLPFDRPANWCYERTEFEISNFVTRYLILKIIDFGKYPQIYPIISVNKNPTRCNSMQIFIYCKATLHVSGVTAPIIRSTKNCNRSLRYRS